MSAQMLKKLTPKTIVGDIKQRARAIENDGETAPLFRIYGIADAVKIGESDYGPWEMLLGRFEAVNIESGVVFQGVCCTVPQPMHGLLRSAITTEQAKSVDRKDSVTIKGQEVRFALDVNLKRRDDLAIGYEFIGSPVIEVSENDAMAQLRAEATRVALPSPPVAGSEKSSKTKAA